MESSIIQALSVLQNLTIKQAMQKLIETSERVLLVVDEKRRLQGMVNDGDIRRALIKGMQFSDTIEQVMCRNFRFLSRDVANKKEKAKAMMLTQKIEHIPVLDADKTVVELLVLADLAELVDLHAKEVAVTSLTNPVVIMAGGKGTRLEPFTRVLPKPLIPIGERPVVEIIMEKFHQFGFSRFLFTLNYKKEYIKIFFKENEFPYNIDWIEETDFMGTAGGLSLLKDKIKETFILTNCDIMVNADYVDMLKWHREHGNLLTVVGSHREVKIPYGVLKLDGGKLVSIDEKPSYDVLINTGMYVIEPEVIAMIPPGERVDMDKLMRMVAERGKVSVYPISNGWIDIGQWDEYRKGIKEFNNS